MAELDLLIRNGSVVDGTGGPGFRADVAVRDGRIAAVGASGGTAARVIDAAGLAVAPGFIDVHAHDDRAVLSTPMDFKLMQGVTTDIVGNCGAGLAPRDPSQPPLPGTELILGAGPDADWRSFGEYMAAVEGAQLALNLGCFVPHGAIRYRTLGMDRREPDAAELEQMREHVAEGMAAGALGLSTGLIYPPGAFASTEEIIALAKVAAEFGGLYMTHMRDEGERLLDAIAEAVSIARGAGLPLEISHHKAAGRGNWGKTQQSIALIEKERAAGLDVNFDSYPYTAGSTVLAVMARRREAEPDGVLIASVRDHPEYEGKTLAQLAECSTCRPTRQRSASWKPTPALSPSSS